MAPVRVQLSAVCLINEVKCCEILHKGCKQEGQQDGEKDAEGGVGAVHNDKSNGNQYLHEI